MAISLAQLLKELLPGLNALFGLEYKTYQEEHKEIYETETSERSFEEETKLSGFSAAPVKAEGAAIAYDNAQEAWTARYSHETIAQVILQCYEQSQVFLCRLRLLHLQCKSKDLSCPRLLLLRLERHHLQLQRLRSSRFPLRTQTPFDVQAHQRK